MLGQDNDDLGGGFDKKQSYSGSFSEFNVWDKALGPMEVRQLAECSSVSQGNLPAKENLQIKWLEVADESIWSITNGKLDVYNTSQMFCNSQATSIVNKYIFASPISFDDLEL